LLFVYLGGEIKIWRQFQNMSSKIKNAFSKKAIIAYVTLGDPSLAVTLDYCKALIEVGVSMIEIGIPFSDPIADGPVIQLSHQNALSTGEDVSVSRALELIAQLHEFAPDFPCVIMSATNLIHRYGYKTFLTHAQQMHCAGIIMPDCSLEMISAMTENAVSESVPLINLISPLCTKDRLKAIVTQSEGFIYLISSTGITGERRSFSNQLSDCITEIKAIKDIPVAIGFGVSTPEHCQKLSQLSDGVIIGSHFVKLMQENRANPNQGIRAICDRVKQFTAVL